jgi:hypothetical protein
MFGKTCLGVFILAGVLVATPAGQVMAGEKVEGVWTCTAVSSGTIERPIIYTFNKDGIFNYSSTTTINSFGPGPLSNTGFHSRGGGRGQWAKVRDDVYNYTAVEFVYDANGNAAGSYSVDATLALTSAGQLCSGRPECPFQKTLVSLVKYVFEQNDPDGDIFGVSYLLGPGASANTLCNRLSNGASFPALPMIPTP